MDDYTYMLEEGLLSEMINFELDTPLPSEANLLGRARDSITQRLGGCYGEVGLLLEVILRAAKQKDVSYFEVGAFKHHCFLLGCDYDKLRTVIVKNIGNVKTRVKFTAQNVKDINEKYVKYNYTRKQLAEEYGVGIHRIKELLIANGTRKYNVKIKLDK